MANTPGRYPLATADGQAIPSDLGYIHSLVQAVVPNAADSGAIAVPTGVILVEITVTVDTIIRLGTAVTANVAGTNYTDEMFIPRNDNTDVRRIIYLADETAIHAWGVAAAGIIYCSFMKAFSGLASQTRLDRQK